MTGKDTRLNVVQRTRRRLSNLLAQQPTAAADWYRIVRNAADAAAPTRVDIYEEIGGGGGWFFDTGVTATDFVNELAGIDGDLEVHINSPGGDVFEGVAIYNALAQRHGKVTTVIDGIAASAASFIAMAGTQRVICPGAMMMIHDASGLCMGNAADMISMADLLSKVSDNIACIYARHSGQPAGWRDAMQAETWYTADEAVAAGLAHRLAQRPDEGALAAAAKFDLSAYLHPPRLTAAATPAAPGHGPFTGTHTHAHPAYGSQDGDATHEHEHTHQGDADHHHTHADAAASDAAARLIAAGLDPAAVHRALGLEAAPLTDKALPVHHTATEDSTWDRNAAVSAMPNDDAVLEYCFAWQSAEAAATPHKEGDDDEDDKKKNYRFPHHRTKGGAASTHACSNGLARLEGSNIPEADKAGVRAHLQAHLDDAHKDDDEGTENHTGLPAWLQAHSTPLPAWFNPAEEAK